MKKILITGADSYIGTFFTAFVSSRYPGEYSIDTIDMVDGSWRQKSFAGYDAVFHVAGLAHQRITPEMVDAYYAVNRDLAVETAKKAKADGAGQFIFLSSMNIYGLGTGVITADTIPTPTNHYGKSKWQAEQGLMPLADDNFTVTVLRPPMVYGKDCKGNFRTLYRLVEKSPIFPRIHNARSLLHIDNLSGFVKKCVDERLSGVYFPQNKEYVDTYMIAEELAAAMGKKLYFSWLAGLAVSALRLFLPVAKKAFGSLIYKDMEVFDFDYCVVDTAESIRKSV